MHKIRQKRTRVVIDGEVIVAKHFSGIGHYTLSMLYALDSILDSPEGSDFSVDLIIYFRHVKQAKQYKFKHINIITSPFSLRITNGLKNHNKQPPLDIFFGKGVYLFPNFTSWPLRKSKSIPFIYDISYEKYPHFADPRNQIFLSTQVKKAAQRATHVATISRSAKSEITQFYDVSPDKVGVYYPAVDTAHYYKRSASEVKNIKRKYSLPDNYILFVGNIEPRKNLKSLLLAYEMLAKDLAPQHPLVLIGAKGWQNNGIFSIIKRLQKQGLQIIFPSSYVIDSDLPAIYSGASLFVYPSIYEGFGIPPIEAMACDVPVICADNSSLPEAAGDAAVYVDALSVNNIAAAMDKVLRNKKLRSSLIKRGQEQVAQFSWTKSASDLLRTIKDIA